MLNFVLSAGLSLGSSFLLNLFGGGNQKPWTTNNWNKVEKFDEPQSRYGEPIYKVFGKVKVTGVYFACNIPPSYETDDNPNPVTRENLRTEIYYGNLGVLWASKIPLDNDPEIKKIWFNKLLYYQNGSIDATLGDYWLGWEGLSLNNHFGDQLSNDEFLNFQGFYNTPHHGMCITAMHRLRLNNGPNSRDNLFNSSYPGLEAEIDTHTSATLYLDEIVKTICLDAGYSESELDVTELSTIEVRGYKCSMASTSEKLKPLQLAYNFEIINTGSQLKFIKQYRSTASAYIPLEALAAHEDGQGRESLFAEKEIIEFKDLPTIIRVTFSNYNKDYQLDSRDSYSLNLTGGKPNIETVDLGNVTLTETEALNIANRLLQLAHLRRKTYKIKVLKRYCGLEAGDVIESPFRYDEITQYQIKDFNESASGIIEITGYPYDAKIYDFSYTAAAPNRTQETATQGSPISTGQTNIISVDSVTNASGSITYVLETDYTVNLGSGTITPIIGGGITTGSTPIIYWSGEAVPATPPSTPDIPPPPTPEDPPVYQELLVSGENIKTINGESLLGSGNISVIGLVDWGGIGGDIEDQTDLKTELDNIRNDAIAYALIFG